MLTVAGIDIVEFFLQSVLLMEEMQPLRDVTTKDNIAIEVKDATLSWGVGDDTPYSTIGL